MPLYDYQCPENGVVIEIHHPMKLTIKTWGDLCERSGHELGDTPADSPVAKLVGAGNDIKKPDNFDIRKDQTPFKKDTMMAPMRDNKL